MIVRSSGEGKRDVLTLVLPTFSFPLTLTSVGRSAGHAKKVSRIEAFPQEAIGH